jgi:hypothetical protein
MKAKQTVRHRPDGGAQCAQTHSYLRMGWLEESSTLQSHCSYLIGGPFWFFSLESPPPFFPSMLYARRMAGGEYFAVAGGRLPLVEDVL